jgi:hypothetical protein
MAVDLQTLFSQDAFTHLEPEKQEVFRRFSSQLGGKSGPEFAGMFMQFNKELNQGRPLTHEEKLACVNAIGAAMPPEDQPKFNHVMWLIKNFI